ncbi:MAG: PLDc N-terminal domain-containing protein, partial [Atopobiaceae bacterium]|nr:PLDc N-terminal domain-containing protein [Atopobiaceae bacterium]
MNETMEHSAAVKNGVKRLALTGVAIVLEVLFILLVVLRFNEQAEWFAIGTRVVSTLLVLLIYNDLKTASMKMTWIILIMALPIFGATLYLLIGL